MRKRYPTDLTDEQWELIKPLLQPAQPGGRPRSVDLREVVNTLLYQARSGCQWDMLPHDLVPKSTAYDYFKLWGSDGTFQEIVDSLRGKVRKAEGRDKTPSAACIDSQSVKTTEIGGEVGFDGGKKVKGRKRHIVVDTLGLLMMVVVTAANLDDGTTAAVVLDELELGETRVWRSSSATTSTTTRHCKHGWTTARLPSGSRTPLGAKGPRRLSRFGFAGWWSKASPA